MKAVLALLLNLLAALPVLALAPGDEIGPDAIAKADFIKGQPVKEWEKDKPYLVYCWATGSPPSVTTLSLIEDFHKNYHLRGLRSVSINVGENDREKVVDLIAKLEGKISHSVAFVPSGDTFQVEWLEAAKVDRIPFAFVVRNGQLVFADHPAKITARMIEALIAGGDQLDDWRDEAEREEVTDEVISRLLRDYTLAEKAGDADGMAEAIKSIAVTKPDFPHLSRMKVDLEIERKDWPAAVTALNAIENPQAALVTAAIISRKFDTASDQPPASLLEAVAEVFKDQGGDDASIKASLARVLWKLGKKDQALAAARHAALNPGRIPKAPLEDFVKSFEDGNPQSLEQLVTAVTSAGQGQSPTPDQ